MAPVPVVVVAGFLGAGKTSLVNHLVRERGDRRIAVVVNDFGTVNIDAELVLGLEGDVYGIAGGCICCSVRDDLLATCLRLVRDFPGLDLLVVETSGASDALQVASAFLRPDIRSHLAVATILGVVDALHFAGLDGAAALLARAQLAAADIVVLNKVDLVPAAELGMLHAAIAAAAPGARIVEACHGRVPSSLLLDAPPGAAGRTRMRAVEVAEGHGLASFVWRETRPVSLARLRVAFDALPTGIYRAKGFVHLDDMPDTRILLQLVGRRSSLSAAGPWGAAPPATEVVVLGTAEAAAANRLQPLLDGAIAGGEFSPLKHLLGAAGPR